MSKSADVLHQHSKG